MFKAQVLRRSFSLFRRTPTSGIAKSAASEGHDAIRIQRVRIRKRFFTRTRLAGTAVVAFGAWKALEWLNEEIEIEIEEEPQSIRRVRRPRIPQEGANGEVTDEEEKEEDDEDEDEDEDDEEEEGLIFIPTGFSRPKPRTYYKGSDPEWQDFVRLAQDRPRIDKIRGELVSLVRDLAVDHPQYGFHIGKIDPMKGSVWIEVKYPDGPPIEYEQPGIELTEDLTFRKTTRNVDQRMHKHLANLLVPTTVANSVYYDIKRIMYASWLYFRKYTGMEESPKPSTARGIIKGLPAPSPPPTAPTQTSTAPSTSTPPPAPATPGDAENQADLPMSPSPPPRNSAPEKLGIKLRVYTMDLSYFRRMLRKHHRPMNIEAPRGTFIVFGLIEILGDKGKMTLDVVAVYDPKVSGYVMLNARAKHVGQYKQMPRGGP